jgi:hypothetical protein
VVGLCHTNNERVTLTTVLSNIYSPGREFYTNRLIKA